MKKTVAGVFAIFFGTISMACAVDLGGSTAGSQQRQMDAQFSRQMKREEQKNKSKQPIIIDTTTQGDAAQGDVPVNNSELPENHQDSK